MKALSKTVIYEVVDGVAVITVDNPPVNALSSHVRDGLEAGFRQALADAAVEAVALVCGGRTFIAGADISEFAGKLEGANLLDVLATMENFPKPLVAGIHGTALGGGLEVALTCHYRVAVASARFGLPEVNIGLLPGAGGTQRLPRVVGVERALHMVTTGKMIGTDIALESGLIEEIVEDPHTGAVAFAQRAVKEKMPLERVRDREDKIIEARENPGIFDEYRKKNARRFRGFDAPENNIKTIEAAVNLPFDEGLAAEAKLFQELLKGPQAPALQYLFFAERQARKIPDLPREVKARTVSSAAVIGAGTMGGGIAMSLASAGIPVRLVEVKAEALERGLSICRKNYETSAAKGRLTAEEVEERMGRIEGSLDLAAAVSEADIVIEAVFESMALKKKVFVELDRHAKPGAILATNTSALDVDQIAASTSRPEDVIGLHFFSPANVMRLVEIVRGVKTAPDVITTSIALSGRIGKVGVLVRVCPGFVGNRILFKRSAPCEDMILSGAAPGDVDRVLLDFGFPMGQFQMADMAGLDIGWDESSSRGERVRDRLCESGRRGLKTGAGYYDYDSGSRIPKSSEAACALIAEVAAKRGIEQRSVPDQEIHERCLYPMVNEAAQILDEGIAIRPGDIDVIWALGYGFPRYRGGLCYWAEQVGLDVIVARLRELEAAEGAYWSPSPALVRFAEADKGFRRAGGY